MQDKIQRIKAVSPHKAVKRLTSSNRTFIELQELLLNIKKKDIAGVYTSLSYSYAEEYECTAIINMERHYIAV